MLRSIFSKIPNWLTFFRVFIIPVIVAIYYLPEDWLSLTYKNILATTLFFIASMTDFLDGWIARHFHMSSDFGEFFDPVADKLLVCAILITLVELERVNTIIALIIIGREITISALREWMAILSYSIRVSQLGKIKTAAQFLGLLFLLYAEDFWDIKASYITQTGHIFMIIAAFLTIISMIDYLIQTVKMLSTKKNHET